MKPDYSNGLENLRRAIKLARLALISDEAYAAAKKADADRQWRYWQDRHARAIAATIGLKLP